MFIDNRLRVLSECARSFAEATTDPERLLHTIGHSVAHLIEDCCAVFLLAETGDALVPVAVHASDPEAQRLIEATLAKLPIRVVEQAAAQHLLETGESLLVPHFDPMNSPSSPEYAAFEKQIGVHSMLLVPLRLRGESIGMLSLIRYRASSPPFEDRDLELGQILADHAAMAIANSRSYAAERRARDEAEAATEACNQSNRTHRLLFEESPFPAFVLDETTSRMIHVNEAALRMYGYTRAEFLELNLADLRDPEDESRLGKEFAAATDADRSGLHRCKNGRQIHVEGTTQLSSFEGRPAHCVVLHDVTERERTVAQLQQLAGQLRQAQKMEAVGRLAGGVAHDFNNALSVILSYAEIIDGALAPSDPVRDDIHQIARAAQQAADLTRQLLMFSRRQVLESKLIDLNDMLSRMQNMVQRLLGKDVQLVSTMQAALGSVRADPSSLEQVVVNLVVNARDAMPTGGKLTIETANVELDEAYAREHLGVQPGPHVMLAVSDTGIGMDQATVTQIFEPFFTMKEQCEGTGLGLSTVFGIVQQSGGSIWVSSELGAGATFTLYLPRVDAVAAPSAPAIRSRPRGNETILLVEDQEQLRVVISTILKRQGYELLVARNVDDALQISREHSHSIHLLLTDLVMPHMSGTELAKRVLAMHGETRVLCMSGYTDDSIVRHGVLEAEMPFLQKPITPDTLAWKVREVLDAPQRDHSAAFSGAAST